ncbi:MAG: hypothetical protein PHX80_04360 [Candidatus Nanoarchaeia archaeon]|nr:hypothetical protein [Candidatus Nanoarchaeia archaeon]
MKQDVAEKRGWEKIADDYLKEVISLQSALTSELEMSKRLADVLREVIACDPIDDDPRLKYYTIQVDKIDVKEARALLAAYNQHIGEKGEHD